MRGWTVKHWRNIAGDGAARAEYTRGDFVVTAADDFDLTTGRYTRKWILLYRGFQQGGRVDASGAGDATYRTAAEAAAEADRMAAALAKNIAAAR
jgi:hypothetical protein